MKIIVILAILSILVHPGMTQNSSNPVPPEEVKQWEFVLGDWEADNRTIARDGSGKYTVNEGLRIQGRKLFEGYGHQVDWFGPDGSYWGSSVRTYNRSTQKWESRWFDIVSSSWQDFHELVFVNGQLVHESQGKDDFGKYRVRRTHTISETGIYTYTHQRLYEGMEDWMVIDTFTAIQTN